MRYVLGIRLRRGFCLLRLLHLFQKQQCKLCGNDGTITTTTKSTMRHLYACEKHWAHVSMKLNEQAFAKESQLYWQCPLVGCHKRFVHIVVTRILFVILTPASLLDFLLAASTVSMHISRPDICLEPWNMPSAKYSSSPVWSIT